jgi:hypothetical protein
LGTLGPKSDIANGQWPRSVSTGDLNGDGVPDLIGPILTPMIGKGDGTFEVGMTPPGTGAAFALGDVNLDGRLDLVRGERILSIALGRGDGTFEVPLDLPHQSPGLQSIALGDLNGDGIPDIVAVAPGVDYDAFPPPRREISIYLGLGNASFGPETIVGTAGAPTSIAIANLNGDAFGDLAVTNYAAEVISLHFGNGDGTFGSLHDRSVGANPWSIQTADFNRDGYPDAATANYGGGTVSVLLGQADGALGSRRDYTIGATPSYLVTGSMDGDDHPDIVAMRHAMFGGAAMTLLGEGDGTFRTTPEVPLDSSPIEGVLGDFNEDHAQDLMLAGWGSLNGLISFLPGSINGLLGPISGIDDQAVGATLGTIWAGDFNNDGHLDAGYVARIPSSPNYLVCVRLGHGDGQFGDRTEIAVTGVPISIVGGDLNRDGNIDLVAVGYRTALTLMGQGDGTFGTGKTFVTPPKPIVARLGDLNADGVLDLVTAGPYSNLVSIQFGTGDGGFGDAVSFGAGQAPVAVAIEDFDGDGRLDISVANADGNTVSLLRNAMAGGGPLAARAFLPGGGIIVLGAGRPTVCVEVEAESHGFTPADVDPSTLYLTSPGTGSIPSVSGHLRIEESHASEKGAAFSVCFTREDLTRLFGEIDTKTAVQATLGGALRDGRRFRANLRVMIVLARGALSAVVAPNPANPTSVLSFATTSSGSMRIDIMDVRGRVVRTIAETSQAAAGYHAYPLDVRTRSNGRMASGVYFVRITTQFDGNRTLRFVVLK